MKFYDFGVSSSLSVGGDTPETMIELAIELGLSGVAFTDFENISSKSFKKMRQTYQNRCVLLTRATLTPKSLNDMKKSVKDLRNNVDIIAVRSKSDDKNVYINAITDKRVDIISLSDLNEFESLNYSHFKMAKENATIIEITIRNLILYEGVQRSKLMRTMSKSCIQLIRSKAPFIISSGAKSKWELRAPSELVALTGLINIPKTEALNAISLNPGKLLQKIEMIRDPNYIMSGVKVVSLENEEKNDDY
ncbi:MAG TPA: RNase P subunit p30 family protein [Candidatus Deferrimicrobium sp.]|nr:RNase P subunit p30 family protein [Candidatus Deferrimicrobium sp.]